ncbi:MAG TPA: type IV toxin-antitoxin system AbiEi family antitoxin domain-containing protein [Ilumatobacteraceae bacterium]|nr:type IV toxin-antitoxin system AbiEi family antitoxin domain-containing protein [Ilumatobacteraceae bacterium]
MPDDAVRAVAELAASQHGAFTRRQAAAKKFSRARIATALRNGWLLERPPGVLAISGHPDTWEQRLTLATLAGGGHGVASHRAAARLHGLDGFACDNHVEVTVDNHHRLRLPADIGATIHHVDRLEVELDVVVLEGIRATGLARTLADLGSVCTTSEVRRALTDVRRRGSSIQWIRQTAQRCHRPGQAGTGQLLRLLDAIPHEGGVPESWFEELLAQCLADPLIPPVVAQYQIRDRRGASVARVDLAIPSVRLGIEAHSRRFHFGPDAGRLDEQRDLAAAAVGWELLYLGWHAAKRPSEVRAVIRQIVEARKSDLSAAM